MGDVAFTIMTAQGRIVEVSKYMLENKHLVRLGMAHDEVVDALCAMMLKHLSDYVAKASTKVLVLHIEISNPWRCNREIDTGPRPTPSSAEDHDRVRGNTLHQRVRHGDLPHFSRKTVFCLKCFPVTPANVAL